MPKPSAKRLYHGGVGGLRAGDRLLPPAESGHPLPRSVSGSYSPYHVYVTANRAYAEIFALPWGVWMANRFAPSDRGVYEVEPHGRLCPDPERPDGLLCSSATVLRRVRGGLDHPVLEALLRWEVEVRRLFDHRPGAADFCWAAEHVAAPGVAPRLLREYALCMPTPGEMEMLSSAERFPELVFGAEG